MQDVAPSDKNLTYMLKVSSILARRLLQNTVVISFVKPSSEIRPSCLPSDASV